MPHLACFFLFFSFSIAFAQSSKLFDDSKVSEIYVNLAESDLDFLYANVSSTVYKQATFVFRYQNQYDTVQNVGFRLRGNTSRYADKKSFKISFNEFVAGQGYEGAKKINLNGQHNDPTLIREKLFYDTWNRLGMPERRSTFVKVYLNNRYYGLYTLLEEIDKAWLQRNLNDDEGNLYKCTYPADLAYIDGNQQSYKSLMNGTATGGRVYELQTNEAVDDYTSLLQLITTLNMPANAQFEQQIQQILDVEGYMKALALDVASGNWDNYAYNKNNYFLYHNLSLNKFQFITYDTDNTFGVDWLGKDWATRSIHSWLPSGENRPLAQKLLAVPAFKQIYLSCLEDLSTQYLDPSYIFPIIDQMKSLITNAVQADSFRTKDYNYTMNDFHNGFTATVDNHTPYGIKPFLQKRKQSTLQYLSQQATAPLPYLFFPNPVTQTLYVEAKPNNAQPLHISLLNSQGSTVWEAYFWENFQKDMSGFVAGTYLMRISDGQKNWTERLVIGR